MRLPVPSTATYTKTTMELMDRMQRTQNSVGVLKKNMREKPFLVLKGGAAFRLLILYIKHAVPKSISQLGDAVARSPFFLSIDGGWVKEISLRVTADS